MATTLLASNDRHGVVPNNTLPLSVEDITPVWLSNCLGVQVSHVEIVRLKHGGSSTVLVDLTYDSSACTQQPDTRLRRRLYVKGGFNKAFIAAVPTLMGSYRREAEFYRHLAPTIPIRVPRSIYSSTDQISGQGIVIMEDLNEDGSTFGAFLEPWQVPRVKAGVEQLARLHGATWGAGIADNPGKAKSKYPWLQGENPMRGIALEMIVPASVDCVRKNLASLGEEFLSANPELLDMERMKNCYHTMWGTEDPKYQCVVHGDAHIANTFLTADGDPGFLDWQIIMISSCFHDVAYFVTSTLNVSDRRQNEESILSHYLDALHASGGPRFAREDVWEEYLKRHFHGFLSCTMSTTQVSQSSEVLSALGLRFATAIVDHGVVGLLESQ